MSILFRYRLYFVFTWLLTINETLRRYSNFVDFRQTYYLIMIFANAVAIIIIISTRYFQLKHLLFMLFAIFLFSTTLIHTNDFTDSVVSFTWIISYICAITQFQVQKMGGNKERQNGEVLVLIMVLVSLIIFAFNGITNFRVIKQGRTNLSEVAFLIYLSPLLLKFANERKSIFRELLILIILFLVAIFSFKRTSLVVVAVSSFIYIYIKYFSGNSNLKTKFIFLILVFLLFVIYNQFDDFTDNFMSYRMSIMFETGGSGRIPLWLNTLTAYKESSITELIFGHGYNSVKSTIENSSHNDFLEVLYNYGMLGIFGYLFFIIRIIWLTYSKKKISREVFAVNAYTVVIFLITSVFSHIVIYPIYNMMFLFVMGTVLEFPDSYVYKREAR